VRDKPATERELGVDDDAAGARWPAPTADASRSVAIALWVAQMRKQKLKQRGPGWCRGEEGGEYPQQERPLAKSDTRPGRTWIEWQCHSGIGGVSSWYRNVCNVDVLCVPSRIGAGITVVLNEYRIGIVWYRLAVRVLGSLWWEDDGAAPGVAGYGWGWRSCSAVDAAHRTDFRAGALG
jgi:hypothetical protein